jgi:hypothetical protein
MSNALTTVLRSVACPTCGAAIGKACSENHDKKGKIVHSARRRLGYITQQPRLREVPFLRVKPVIRGEANGYCKRGNCSNCPGKYRVNHGGGKQPCGCSCHREQAATKVWAVTAC